VITLTGGPRPGSIVQGRLEAIGKGVASGKAASEIQLIRDELLSGIPALNRFFLRWGWMTNLRALISQAGMRMRPGKLVLICAVLGFLAFESCDLTYRNMLLALLAGVLAAMLPLFYIAFKRARRFKAFERQFPEVIELLARSVRAGHSFTSGLEIVATDMADPAAGEFRTTFDEQRFGLPIRDALLSLCERVPLVDVRFFAIALLVQKETGGNLAEIMDNLAHVIRERFRIAGEVRIRTAQGRLTASILIAMPIVMLVILKVINPEYASVLFADPWGRNLLFIAACMQLVGAGLLWKIVRINV
jgi:tight adherence protein B